MSAELLSLARQYPVEQSYLIYSSDIKQTVSDIQLLNYREITSIYSDLE